MILEGIHRDSTDWARDPRPAAGLVSRVSWDVSRVSCRCISPRVSCLVQVHEFRMMIMPDEQHAIRILDEDVQMLLFHKTQKRGRGPSRHAHAPWKYKRVLEYLSRYGIR